MIICVAGTTSYRNHNLLVSTVLNICLLVKYLANNTVFEQRFRRDVEIKTLLCNVFGKSILTSILSEVTLKNYLNCAKKNLQNINM